MYNTGQVGGGLNIESILKIQIQGSLIQGNMCLHDKRSKIGGINIDNMGLQNDLELTNIFIQNTKFIANLSYNIGGLMVANILDGEGFLLDNSIFLDNRGFSGHTGGLQIYNVKSNIIVQNLGFNNNTCTFFGGGVYVEKTNYAVFQNIVSNSSEVIVNGGFFYIGENVHIILRNLDIKNSLSTVYGGSIGAFGTNQIEIYDTKITNSESKQGGALYFISCNQTIIQDVVINNTTALQGAGIYLDTSTISILIQNVFISNSNSESNGGAIYAFLINNAVFSKINLTNNTSGQSGGGIILLDSYNITLQNMNFENNQAQENGGGMFVKNSRNISISDIYVQNNEAKRSGGGVYLSFIETIQFQNIHFHNNTAINDQGGGIHLGLTQNINFENITFYNNTAVYGGGLAFIDCKNMEAQEMEILNNIALEQGGGLLFIQGQNINLKSIKLENNIANNIGGAISITNIQQFTVLDFQILNNIALQGQGGGVYLYNQCVDILFKQGLFKNNTCNYEGGAVYALKIISQKFSQTNFTQNKAVLQGGSISSKQFDSLIIEECQFLNHIYDNIIERGSVVYLINSQTIDIYKSKFDNNLSQIEGGAIFIEDSQNVVITKNQFNNNKLDQQKQIQGISRGGTLFLDKCKQLQFTENDINNSYAQNYGGALFLTDIYQLEIKKSLFNKTFVDYDQNLDILQKKSNYKLTQGGSIYIESLHDLKNQYAFEENIFINTRASSGGGIMINNNLFNQIQVNIKNCEFKQNTADIGSSVRIIGKNNNFINQGNSFEEQIIKLTGNLPIYEGYFRNEKQIIETQSQFSLCQQGQVNQEGGGIQCQICDQNAICEGGYIDTYPKPKYWRFSKDSEEFFYCDYNPEACLGNDQCKIGHIGLMCEQCDRQNDYSTYGNTCEKCAPKYILFINLFVLFLFVCILLANQIYGLNSRIKRRLLQKSLCNLFDLCFLKVGQLSGITKIFLMHCQILYLVASNSIEFPYEVSSAIQIVGNPQKLFSTSLDCLLSSKDINEKQSMDYFLAIYGLIALSFVLVFLLIVEIALYFGTKIIRNRKNLVGYIKGSVSCFFLMVQPGVLQNSLQFVVCRTVGGQQFNLADSSIKCEDDLYKKEILPVNISMVFILGFLIPIVLAIILYKLNKKQRLGNVYIQRSLGIFYLEVQHQFYYWEIVAIIIKISVVVNSIAFQQEIIIKSCINIVILMGYLIICYKLQPYKTKTLNSLSVIATVVQLLSIILSVCVYELDQEKSEEDFQTGKIILTSIMLITNSFFLIITGYNVILEFEWMFRNLFIKFLGDKNLFNIIKQKIQKEKTAKLKWRNIKIAIHQSNLALRRITVKHPEIHQHFFEVFQLYYSNVKDPDQNVTFLKPLNIDSQIKQLALFNIVQSLQNDKSILSNMNIVTDTRNLSFTIKNSDEKQQTNQLIPINNNNNQIQNKKRSITNSTRISHFNQDNFVSESKRTSIPAQVQTPIYKRSDNFSHESNSPKKNYNYQQSPSIIIQNSNSKLNRYKNNSKKFSVDMIHSPLQNINQQFGMNQDDLSMQNISRQELFSTNRSILNIKNIKSFRNIENFGDSNQEIDFDIEFNNQLFS